MEKIGKPRFVPSATEVRCGIEIPTVKLGGGGCGSRGYQGYQGELGPRGYQGEHGHMGPQGKEGKAAAGWKMRGYADSILDLPVDEENGAAYIVGDVLWIYIGIGKGRRDTPGDAYVDTPVAIVGPQGYQGVPGAMGRTGIQGARGFQGVKGKDGTSINILGDVDSIEDLPWPAEPGDTYSCNSKLYMFKGENEGDPETPHDAWKICTIDVQGVQGPQGYQGPVGEQGPQGEQGSQGEPGAPGLDGQAYTDRVITREPIEVSFSIGSYIPGMVIPAGTSIDDIIRNMLTEIIIPTYVQPDMTMDNEPKNTYNETIPRRIMAQFFQGDAGNEIKWKVVRNGVEIARGNGIHVDYTDSEPLTEDLRYDCIFSYSEGPIKYDSLGRPVPGHIEAGSMSKSVNYNYVSNKNFHWLAPQWELPITDINSVTQLTEYGTVNPGDVFDLNLDNNAKVVIFAVKAGLKITRILDRNIGYNIISTFEVHKKYLKQTGDQIPYTIYYYDPLAGLDATTYEVEVKEDTTPWEPTE